MYQLIRQFLTQWNADKNQRNKLQQAYFVSAVLFAIAAGVATVINLDLSRSLIVLAAALTAVYLINGVVWALLEALVAPRLPKPQAATTKTSRRKR